ncbi:two-component system sensor histidine kinase NtrB [Roseibacillus ishigakijimensis]|uniref:histidine kinase n=1 Tax=Roseibacillus ishigakijimensis TaxID=454146 RepID=A0A934RPI9_9BACT|nr:ATP-binding protein [Roseibacillus ishigakijimensis]MBK1832749.1 PAS domain-containing protein [Roseibacillus ishigakijimensis]
MKSSFIDKLLSRLDRLSPRQVQTLVDRLLRDKGFLESVFEALREGVLILTPEGLVTFLNSAAARLFGLDVEKATGQPLAKLVRGLDWESLSGGKTPSVVSRDLEVFYPEHRFLNFYLSPIVEDVEGSPRHLGTVMLVRDLTEARRTSEENLESEKLNALTLLAAGVAHEIGNPLNSLGIHLQLLERKIKKLPPGDSDSLLDHLSTARTEIRRLDTLLQEFLHAIRPARAVMQASQLNELIRDTLKTLEPELAAREIRIQLELHADLPQLPLDPDQIRQALFNLIKNAYQAVPASGGDISIATTQNEHEVLVRIEDSGDGISPEVLGSLFEPYSTTKSGGTGLGLLIVRRILREHGGEIEIQSEEGQGTAVTLHFPRTNKRARLLPAPESAPDDVIEI